MRGRDDRSACALRASGSPAGSHCRGPRLKCEVHSSCAGSPGSGGWGSLLGASAGKPATVRDWLPPARLRSRAAGANGTGPWRARVSDDHCTIVTSLSSLAERLRGLSDSSRRWRQVDPDPSRPLDRWNPTSALQRELPLALARRIPARRQPEVVRLRSRCRFKRQLRVRHPILHSNLRGPDLAGIQRG